MATAANHSWVPSAARVVLIEGFGAIPRGAWMGPSCQLAWPPKDPGETLDYIFDISQALYGNEGDCIATLDISISPANPGDLVLQSASADGAQAILWLSAGTAGVNYAVTLTIGTNSGRILARTVTLPVITMAAPGVVSNAITDEAGEPIVTQSGDAITTS